jgi:hypothetical protein
MQRSNSVNVLNDGHLCIGSLCTQKLLCKEITAIVASGALF